jgi:O-acetyl-ADP-ribose deacetylase (regulator of RNase III)
VSRIRVVQADITQLEVDAIVNAANERMLGGGGVDGAIHRAAGRELVAACEQVPELRPGVRCPTGEARITPGYRLPAKFVIHTVGPVWRGGEFGEARLLAACYRSSLALAVENGLRSIAFPAISCGVFRYPVYQASQVAVRTIEAALEAGAALDRILLVAFEPEMRGALELAVSARPDPREAP